MKTRIGWAFRCSLSWMGLPSDELLAALQRGQFAPAVREHFMGGVRSRVNGTPTFFINGQRHEGAYEFEFLVEAKAVVNDIEVRLAPGSERIDREQVSK
ncbi:MAG: DsbA family protein [Terriglobales bacterium]